MNPKGTGIAKSLTTPNKSFYSVIATPPLRTCHCEAKPKQSHWRSNLSSFYSFLFIGIFSLLILSGCGSSDSGLLSTAANIENTTGDTTDDTTGDTTDTGGTTSTTTDLSGKIRLTSTVKIASGKPSSEIANATVYAIGQESSKTTTNSNGEFTLLVDAKQSGAVLQKSRALPRRDSTPPARNQYGIIVASNTREHGKKFEITGNDGDDITLPSPVEITEVGSISGKVTLQNKTDNTGIMVYIPGTSFMALTDASGNFTISSIPEGTYLILRAEKDGYNYSALSNITVQSNKNTAVANQMLLISTGAKGSILINNGASISTSRTIDINISATDNAVLMTIAEEATFQNTSWIPIQSYTTHTFTSDGDKTLYIKFADANGLESTTYSDSITIDTIAPETSITSSSSNPSNLTSVTFSFASSETGSTFQCQIDSGGYSSCTSPLVYTGLSEGSHTFEVKAIDLAGNIDSTPASHIWVIETAAPANPSSATGYNSSGMSVTLTSENWYNYSAPYFVWTGASDGTGSGVAGYYVYFGTSSTADPATSGIYQTGSTFTSTSTLSSDSTYYLMIKTKDNAGNIASTTYSGFIYKYDSTIPTGTISINSGANYTNSTSVTLTLSCLDSSSGCSGMQFSNDNSTWSTAETYAVSKAWTLSTTDGTKTVYVKFKDSAGSWSFVYNDTIILDTTVSSNPTSATGYSTSGKTTTLTSGNWYNYSAPYFEWTGASDGTGSGIAGYYIYFGTSSTADPATSGIYQTGTTFTSTSTLSSGSIYYLLIKTKDNAENVSTTTLQAFIYKYDSTAPSIPTGLTATVISDNQINLSWTASTDDVAVTGYKIYRDGTYIASSESTSYSDTGVTGAATYTYTILAVDAAGNESAQSTSKSATSSGTAVTGSISTNTTWTSANSPYIVTGNIMVNSGTTLTINAGVTVKFNSGKSLQVNGTLIAIGISTNKITFTSSKYSPAAGDWGNISFTDTSTDATYENGNYTGGSILEYCIIEYGGANNGLIQADSSSPYITNSLIKNSSTDGVYISTGGAPKIDNNTINNCTKGISGSGTSTIINNTLKNNSYGAYLTYRETFTNNLVSDNTSYGIYTTGGCGYMGTISKNIVKNNSGWGIYSGSSCNGVTISDNVVISNSKGIYLNTGNTVTKNIIANNSGRGFSSSHATPDVTNNAIISNNSDYAVYFAPYSGTKNLQYNTIVQNNATSMVVYLYSWDATAGLPLFNNNNLFNNTSLYDLGNNYASTKTLNSENNYWGTTIESEIQTKIYDLNDASVGFVDYSPYLNSPDTTAPISPPTGLTATAGTGQISLSWTANTEGDKAGYKVYWDTDSGYPYANSVDAGNVISYTIGSLPVGTYYVTVTAYDSTASSVTDDPATIINEKQTAGNESWYATEKSASVTSSSFKPSPSPQSSFTGGEEGESSPSITQENGKSEEHYAVGCGTINPNGGNGNKPKPGSDPALMALLLLSLLLYLRAKAQRHIRLWR